MGSKEFGNRLREAREKAGLTQSRVCTLLNISKAQTLSSYERGVNSPPLEMLKELAKLYNVSTDNLIFGENYVPAKAKTKEDYVRQLVDAVDNLGLKLASYEDTFLHETNRHIILSPGYSKELDKFAEKWIRLRDLLDNKIIEQDEYGGLIEQRLNSLQLVKPGYIPIDGNEGLPF